MFIWKPSMIKYELFHQVLNDWKGMVNMATVWISLAIQCKLTLCVCVCASNQRHEKTSLKMAIVRVAACMQYVHIPSHARMQTYTKKETIWKNRHISIETKTAMAATINSAIRLFRTMFLSLSTGNEFSWESESFVFILRVHHRSVYSIWSLFSAHVHCRFGLIQFGRPNKHHNKHAQKKNIAARA